MESERAVGGAMSMVISYCITSCIEVKLPSKLQGPWLDWFIDTANEYPYLWALYAFAIVSPFVLCAAFCVKSKVTRRTFVP